MDENTAAPQNTEIQQPAVAATDSHASANAELAEKLDAAIGKAEKTTQEQVAAAIAQQTAAQEPAAVAAPHPAHGVLDEIEKKLATELRTVSAASLAWLREKLADVRAKL